MSEMEFPAPDEGVVLTHLLIVSDVDRSRAFYSDILGARVLLEKDPCILKFSNSWIVLAEGGGPTEDKPTITMAAPADANTVSSALNIRVADIHTVHESWSRRGAQFLTPPTDRGVELRCYLRDPDGHLIEVGQLVSRPGG